MARSRSSRSRPRLKSYPACGAAWDPFELAEERAAGNDELWHDCLTEEAT